MGKSNVKSVDQPSKHYFNNKFSSFSSSSSFIKLLSFGRKNKEPKQPVPCNKCIIESKETENIYANICEHENDYESLKSNVNLKNTCWYPKFVRFLNKNDNKREVKRFHRKINKDDIKVADDNEMIDVKNIQNKKNENNSDGKKKLNIEIINTGLASTTNELINHSHIKPIKTISNNEIQTKTKNVSKNNIHKPSNSNLHSNINKINIVQAGLSSTSSVEIVKNKETAVNNDVQLNVKELKNKFNRPVAIDLSNLPKRSDLRKVNK